MERIAGAKGRLLQKSAVRRGGLTLARRKRFLDMLATTCNVTRSAAAADASAASFYRLRARDAAFAGLWQEAILLGYQQLEEALLSRALEGVNALTIEVADGISALSPDVTRNVQLALALLNRHQPGKARPVRSGSVGGGPGATTEETDAALCKKLDSLGRRMKGVARAAGNEERE